jgi:DNA invertase Pin-like site-specific DNA recombinase
LLDFIRAGDVLVVVKADRLGRNTRDDPAIDTSGDMGKMVLTVLGMVSQMELTFIKERQRAGIDKAKAEGRYASRQNTF